MSVRDSGDLPIYSIKHGERNFARHDTDFFIKVG